MWLVFHAWVVQCVFFPFLEERGEGDVWWEPPGSWACADTSSEVLFECCMEIRWTCPALVKTSAKRERALLWSSRGEKGKRSRPCFLTIIATNFHGQCDLIWANQDIYLSVKALFTRSAERNTDTNYVTVTWQKKQQMFKVSKRKEYLFGLEMTSKHTRSLYSPTLPCLLYLSVCSAKSYFKCTGNIFLPDFHQPS